jgi:DNA-binding CsgD family transcriptional regulator
MEQGRLRDAETIAEGVLKIDRLTWVVRLPALIVLARVKVRLGDSSAQEWTSQALHDALARDETQYILPAYFCLVEAAWLGDKRDTAVAHLQSIAAIDISEMHKWQVGEFAAWSHRLGYELPDSYSANLPAPYAAEIQGDSSGAAAAWEDLGAPYEAALALLNGGGETNSDAIIRAIKLLEPLHARAANSKARKLAGALGFGRQMPRARRGPYRSARHHPLGLTKREQHVLKELATGATNREISENLNRSPRTVEHHVSSVLAKLSVSNRMEAMLRVQSEPWLLPK